MLEIIAAGGVFALDQYFKEKIDSRKHYQDRKILNGHVTLTRYHNNGVFLNILEKQKKLVLAVTSVVFGFLLAICGASFRRDGRHLLKWGLSLLTGGAASNLLDRYRKGYVVDYFTFKKFPRIVFNLGDLAIFLGGLLLVSDQWVSGRK